MTKAYRQLILTYWLEHIGQVYTPSTKKGGIEMTLCPVALVAGCKKCPAVTFCPLKSVIGDYQKPGETQTKQDAKKARGDANRDK